MRLPETPFVALLPSTGVDVSSTVARQRTRNRRAVHESKVYEGSTHDPALFEWGGNGAKPGATPPQQSAATGLTRVLYTYSQWLPSQVLVNSLRTYRFPMVPRRGSALIIQELDIEVDVSHAGTRRRGARAALSDDHKAAVLQRTDFVPVPIRPSSWSLTSGSMTRRRVYHVPQDPPRPIIFRQARR